MKKHLAFFLTLTLICISFFTFQTSQAVEKVKNITIVISANSHNRIKFGADKLKKALNVAGIKTNLLVQDKLPKSKQVIAIGLAGSDLIKKASSAYNLSITRILVKKDFQLQHRKIPL